MRGGAADSVGGGDLAQAQTLLAIAKDGFAIQVNWLSSDLAAFESSAPHSRSHALDDEVAFEFSDDSDDYDDGTAQRTAGVHLFSKRDELDAEVAQLVEDLEQMPG